MRAYPEQSLRRLLDEHVATTAFGHPVEVKRSTEEEAPGHLDPYLVAAHEDSAGKAKELGIPRSRLRMLLNLTFRPEKFMVDMRHLASDLVLSGDGDLTVDLSERPIQVSHQTLRLHEHPVTLWQYRPSKAAHGRRPAFLHLHGGGFFAGTPTGRDNVLRLVADQADAVVFDLDYSLSPEVKFPHAVHEVVAAVRHIRDHAEDYGLDPDRIVVGGGSAGANLTAAATLLQRDLGLSLIAGQVLIAPALLLGPSKPTGYEWRKEDFVIDDSARAIVGPIIDPSSDRSIRMMSRAYRGDSDPDTPLISPAMASDLSGLPPALVITCEMDSLRPHGEYYAARLASAGVPVRTLRYRGIMHATPGQIGLVPASEAIAREIAAVLNIPHRSAPGVEPAADHDLELS